MLNAKLFIHILCILSLMALVSCTGGEASDTDGDEFGDTTRNSTDNGGFENGTGDNGPSEDNPLTALSRGVEVWMDAGCRQCHRIGDDPGGDAGPALTDVGDRFTKEELMEWIRNPQAVDPDATMPSQDLDEENLEYLARYLSMLSSDTPQAVE